MANNDWVTRARKFLNNDFARLKAAKTDLELRVATIDSHAVLESTLRGYLAEIQGIEDMFDKSKINFRTVVQVHN